jgi:nucleotide-binding universal stress UspA family protein
MAIYVAKQFDSKLDFVHVTSPDLPDDPSAGGAGHGGPPAFASRRKLSGRLDELAQQAVSEGVRSAEAILLGLIDGDAFERINAYAESHEMNLIMAGAGQESTTGQVFLGTTASRLRRFATTPVCIVKPGTAPPIRQVLCPVDMESASSRALANAIHFARKLDAELTVLTVAHGPLGEDENVSEVRQPATETPRESSEPYQRKFEDFLRKFDFHQVRWEKVIRRGKPQDEVVQLARDIAADLIVMGSAGRTGLSRMLVGGVARRVAQELPCSIITVRGQSPITVSIDGEVPQVVASFCASHPSGANCDRFRHGDELLHQGLADEAIEHYEGCVEEYSMCANAWLQLSEAHTRLGNFERARQCATNAEEALRQQENKRIEDEVRGSHVLYRRLFDI